MQKSSYLRLFVAAVMIWFVFAGVALLNHQTSPVDCGNAWFGVQVTGTFILVGSILLLVRDFAEKLIIGLCVIFLVMGGPLFYFASFLALRFCPLGFLGLP